MGRRDLTRLRSGARLLGRYHCRLRKSERPCLQVCRSPDNPREWRSVSDTSSSHVPAACPAAVGVAELSPTVTPRVAPCLSGSPLRRFTLQSPPVPHDPIHQPISPRQFLGQLPC